MRIILVFSLLTVAACGAEDGHVADPTTPAATQNTQSGLVEIDGQLHFRTAPFEVPAGTETFLCYAHTLTEDVVLDSMSYTARPVIHHLLFARTMAPEPEGVSECDVLFRPTWVPLFGAGSGDASLNIPQGAGHLLPAGTQLLVQLHLLNSTSASVTDVAQFEVTRSTAENPRTVGLATFGLPKLNLPARATSSTQYTCTVDRKTEIFAALPHMHYLGQRLMFEVGDSEDTLKEVYRRDPWVFDDQYIEPFTLTLEPGQVTRVTCDFDNPSDEVVTFGESSLNEMCFLITYALDEEGFTYTCSYPEDETGDATTAEDSPLEVPRDPAAGQCGDHTPNDRGIGVACSKGGGECPATTLCSADQSDEGGDTGFCLSFGCNTNDSCGGGATTCCAPSQGGGIIKICIPEACRPTDCIP